MAFAVHHVLTQQIGLVEGDVKRKKFKWKNYLFSWNIDWFCGIGIGKAVKINQSAYRISTAYLAAGSEGQGLALIYFD